MLKNVIQLTNIGALGGLQTMVGVMVCVWVRAWAHAGVKQTQWGGVRRRWELNWLQIDWSQSHCHCH